MRVTTVGVPVREVGWTDLERDFGIYRTSTPDSFVYPYMYRITRLPLEHAVHFCPKEFKGILVLILRETLNDHGST